MRGLECCRRKREYSVDLEENHSTITYEGRHSCVHNNDAYDQESSTSNSTAGLCSSGTLEDDADSSSSSKDDGARFSSCQWFSTKQDECSKDDPESLGSSLKFGYDEKPPYTVQIDDVKNMRERFSRLLLGEDVTGGCKGMTTALALSNAINNLAGSIFGELWKLEPLSEARKSKWRREMDWLPSPTNHMVELVPAKQQVPNGRSLEIMIPRVRPDIVMNIPALKKLDEMLIEMLASMVCTEFWYSDEGSRVDGRTSSIRPNKKWWLPVPRVPVTGLSVDGRKKLESQAKFVHQVFKAAKSINESSLSGKPVPLTIQNTLPRTLKVCLGETLHKSLRRKSDLASEIRALPIMASEYEALATANRLQMAIFIMKERISDDVSGSGKVQGRAAWLLLKDSEYELEKMEVFLQQLEVMLLSLKVEFPNLPPTLLDMAKLHCNKDIGLAILEAYSRVIGNLAFSIFSRIRELLEEDDLTKSTKV